ncbi:bacillithiol biosynthesis cysteine-adding enzyme BshC [Deinococcus sp. HMF7604]|uniref:bacillithiol biosynthesis cysteine-adding enzyme BshC n=1 Tax=Deinococcus betulae TaxID=2873312 RepID=UPI001CCCB3F6|nr:bacillithiol biosynthesis cysteine-adding enzyme BshC [Deinococcus betulae]MBZ9749434.1 bacillithiol biosynthesis cysteine-adding enzyme BshC [Deinococcus betulae]
MAKSAAAEFRQGHMGEYFRLPVGATAQALTEEQPDLDRRALASALRDYHRDLGTLNADIEAQLERLAHPRSRVVVTGQQAGALTGPAYAVHKGADAALLARQLHDDNRPVVAVYWVASQDHDAAEVASTTLLDMNERLHRLTLDVPAGVPVGRVPWRPEWTAQVHALLETFDAPAEHVRAVRAWIDAATRAGGSYADVFARLMHGLLAPAGLVVLDPMHPALARLMAPTLARELRAPLASSAAIEAAAMRLEQDGFEPQLRRPAGATNLFLEEEDGQRRLLRAQGRELHTETRTYTVSDLLTRLDADPTRLTPAAGLRPAVQDALLPTLAFVVGPGEIAYAAQLRDVYPLHGLHQPLLWPRLSVTWLEPNVARLLGRLKATAAQVQTDPEGVLGRALAAERGAGAAAVARLDALDAELRELTADLGALDPTLTGAAERTRARTTARVAHLQTLAIHALARAENDRTRQLSRLKAHLLPGGVPQERELNFLSLLLKHGDAPLRQLLGLPAGFQGEVTIA